MTTYGNIPFQSIQFDEDGEVLGSRPTVPEVTDLIVISHGWNNDAADATGFYSTLLENVSASLALLGGPAGRSYGAVGVYWPSKQFDFDGRGEAPVNGGGHAVKASSVGNSASPVVANAMAQLASLYDKPEDQERLANVREIVAGRRTGGKGGDLVDAVRELIAGVEQSDLDASRLFFGTDKFTVFQNAAKPLAATFVPTVGAAATGQVQTKGVGNFLDAIENGFANVLNVASYYTMKTRASTVGVVGLAPCLNKWSTMPTIERIHLVGHSFGARLVTAAAMASVTGNLSTMSLLQAAFSHNAFATGGITGYFRNLVEKRRIKGPVIVTFSKNDSAVGKAYAIASRVSGTNNKAIGDENDQYGGLGANGALHMQAGEFNTSKMVANGQAYALKIGHFNNLESTAYISSHGDVRNENVAWAVASAIRSAPSH